MHGHHPSPDPGSSRFATSLANIFLREIALFTSPCRRPSAIAFVSLVRIDNLAEIDKSLASRDYVLAR
jgi:hypothetical protein